MTVMIDGEEVFEGDAVYDLVYGNGVVTQVTGTSFSASVAGRVYNYTTGGFYNGNIRQRVFWSDPILAHPTKHDSVWRVVRNMVSALIAELRKGGI